MRWAPNRYERPPHVGARVLVRSAVAAVAIILVTGAGVAAALYIQLGSPDKIAPLPKGAVAPAPIKHVHVTPVTPGGPRTILVLGSDRRAKSSKDAALGFTPRSDTILLVRLDPKSKRIATLSIPRDLAVTIPGYGLDKINAAYTDGGAALTLDTIKSLFETATGKTFPINSVIDIDFDGFQRAVNYVGGVWIDVDHDYYIPPDSGVSAIDLKAGYQRLVGSQALAYVRFRHTDSDLYRAARQQDFLRQAANQPAVRRVENTTDGRRLLGIMREYMHTDKDFWTRKNLFGMLKTAVYLGLGHAPVNQIQFTGVQDAPDPETDTRLYISQPSLAAIASQFLTGKGSKNPKRVKHTTAHRKVTASKVSGLEYAKPLGENLAVLADAKLDFPFYFPAYRTIGSRYEGSDSPRIYKLTDEAGKRHEAYRLVIAKGGPGEYYGVQGTTWRNPPILDAPDRVIRQNGRRLLEFYDGSHLRLIGWKTPRAVYWVSNTVTHSIANSRLVAIAASLTHLKQ